MRNLLVLILILIYHLNSQSVDLKGSWLNTSTGIIENGKSVDIALNIPILAGYFRFSPEIGFGTLEGKEDYYFDSFYGYDYEPGSYNFTSTLFSYGASLLYEFSLEKNGHPEYSVAFGPGIDFLMLNNVELSGIDFEYDEYSRRGYSFSVLFFNNKPGLSFKAGYSYKKIEESSDKFSWNIEPLDAFTIHKFSIGLTYNFNENDDYTVDF